MVSKLLTVHSPLIPGVCLQPLVRGLTRCPAKSTQLGCIASTIQILECLRRLQDSRCKQWLSFVCIIRVKWTL